MKTIFALTILAVIAAISDSSVVKVAESPAVNVAEEAQLLASRANLIIGSVGVYDRLLYRSYFSKGAIANAIQYQDVAYHGNSTTRVTAVQALEVGASQLASARIISGGIGRNNVTVRFQSARGRGYYYQLSIFGR